MSTQNGQDCGPSGELAELIDGLAARLQAGEAVDVEAVAREHPAHAGQIRELLPALGALDELSRSRGEGPPGAGRRRPRRRGCWATTASSARSAAAVWGWSTRPSRCRWA